MQRRSIYLFQKHKRPAIPLSIGYCFKDHQVFTYPVEGLFSEIQICISSTSCVSPVEVGSFILPDCSVTGTVEVQKMFIPKTKAFH